MRTTDTSNPDSACHDLKRLQTRRRELSAEIGLIHDEIATAQRDMAEKRKRLATIDQQIEAATVKEPIVTDHAMLRYCERVMGVNLNDIKKRVLCDEMAGLIDKLPSGKFPHPDGFRVVVKNRTVVTIE